MQNSLLWVLALQASIAFGEGGNLDSIKASCSQRGFSFGPCAKKKDDYAKGLTSEKIKVPTSLASDPSPSLTDDNGGNFNKAVGKKMEDGVDAAQGRISAIEDDTRRMSEETKRRIDDANRRAQQLAAQKAEAERSAAEKAEIERQKRLIEEARLAARRGKPIPSSVVNDSKDPQIRDELLSAAIANDLKIELEKKKKEASLNLAQLLQMAAITMQAATNLNSVEGTSPSQNLQTFDPTRPVAPKAALAGRSPASLGDKEGTISTQTDDPALAEGENGKKELSAKDKETLAKIKTEVEAAEKRKKIQAMRLKQKLREKANAQGKGAVDTDELFGGSLNQDIASAESDKTEETAAKESAMSASSVYQVVKEGFSLAGSETDREVGQIISEAQRDLSSEEMSAGVLGRESPSLFARVHSVHQACQRQKCVLSLK